MNKRFLIVDLDDTVLDFKGGEIADVKAVFKKHCGLDQAQVEEALKAYQKINKALWKQYELEEIERDVIFKTRYPKTLAALGLKADAEAMENDYATLRDQNYRTLDGAEEVLKTAAEHYTVLVGTNGQDETQRRRLKETGFDQYFDKIYTSEQIGHAKPDTDFYEAIFEDNPDMTKENTVMIGDGIFSDMLGGQRYGIDRIWVNLDGKQLPENITVSQTVTALSELQTLLAEA
ncbi:noncanonical pyrimidine nucleotidase, YjjG family [Fructobacillus sp. M2-14]|uniref:Noncanonical pyrimidine nucleotidase, YjjG family n=1 Tax=Fructobacillus broussonetiae TaxID=2713173 RepID=A0ABS5QYC4_9LACO|nr:YjjG family noncanonical pyrimidine nucleotidase [Fructobacillus broussonetiae]MBS9338200.1 noncanonical pyrimidine nucleotidase, YjjG family [Fructobacillus broussonetiae]